MATGKRRQVVWVSSSQREALDSLLRRTTVGAGLARRARAILLLANGTSISETGRIVRMQRRHLYKWAERFRQRGIAGLSDGKRTGRPPVFSPRSSDASGQDRLRAAG